MDKMIRYKLNQSIFSDCNCEMISSDDYNFDGIGYEYIKVNDLINKLKVYGNNPIVKDILNSLKED